MGFDAEHMHIFVETTNHKYFLVVSDSLTSEELFWLFETAFRHPLYFVGLGVEVKAITDPAIVTSKYQDFTVIESKGTEGVSW